MGAGIRPARPRARLDVLSEDRCGGVHEAALRILDEVGIGLTTEAPAELGTRLLEAGARLEGNRVRLGPKLVEAALRGLPGSLSLAARAPGLDLSLDGSRSYLSVDGCAAEILPVGADAPRASCLEDVVLVTRLADALEEISFVWQPVAARDVPQEIASLHELRVQLESTRKHVQMMTASTRLAAEGVVEMAREAAGGARALRDRPIVSAFQCSVSPLGYEPGALEAAVLMAEAGMPCGFVAMPIAGASAPITPWGVLVQTHAEVIAGIALLRTLVPGASTFYGACSTVMDLVTGAAACGGPEDLWLQLAAAQLARHHGLVAQIGTFATGSPRSDWQAGLEDGISGVCSLLAGASMLCGAGLLEAASVFSPEQMVLDAEAFGLAAAFVEAGDGGGDAELDEIADLVGEVGPGGHFLDRDHTLEHMEELWRPFAFTREGRDGWRAKGRPGPRDRAREQIEEILAMLPPVEPDPSLEAVVREYTARLSATPTATGLSGGMP